MTLSVVVRAAKDSPPLNEFLIMNAEIPAVPFAQIVDTFNFLYSGKPIVEFKIQKL